jgi:Arc/MetJ-type ribon-helix-helix transcriptional regulator
MKNTMVSIRVPSSLIDEFKDISKKDHFLDLSEAVRSIIRDSWVQNKDPSAYQLKKLKEEISDNISKKNMEDVLTELRQIRDKLSKDE